ncbi:MAG TPA: DUF3365 domain-containing protein [Campylobacterales bacterium]|nr:DUF3365 domain-containing protein [Campylobacterales bacterium]
MTKKLILTSLLCATVLYAGDTNSTTLNADKNITKAKTTVKKLSKKQEGIKYIKMLGRTLKTHLKAEMKADKTALKAIDFCATKADKLTKEVNAKLPKNAKVRRTSLLTRNENNKPDALDKAIMEEIISDMNKTNIDVSKPLMVETPTSYRVYKPLFVKPVCLKCHGTIKDVSAKVQKAIISKYPNDKAVGFKQGDLRGVIVSEITK